MRSVTRLPSGFQMFPQYLREAGYYCTNNSKEDYNLDKPGMVWDASGGAAHWRNREPGQPFFSVFNFETSHESQIRNAIPQERRIHDPSKVRVPAYHPDAPEVRDNWAQYYDRITMMDEQVGEKLNELRDAGLAEDTIVFYFGDHGSGMPRSKRWPYNSGLNVPLIVHVPEKHRRLAGQDFSEAGKKGRLVGFIDFAPTVLSLAGVRPPEHFQGTAFMGRFAGEEQEYLYGFRGRMDSRYDLVRVVRDKRYVYIRNYMPHKIYGQHIAYMFKTPATRVWKQMFDAGVLSAPKTLFWEQKPPHELYDLQQDPDEVNNLASSGPHQTVLERLRSAQKMHAVSTRDLGFLPEVEIHSRAASSSPYEVGLNDSQYPLHRILEAAEIAAARTPLATLDLERFLLDEDSAVRYWGAMGALIRGPESVEALHQPLTDALGDTSPAVQIVAAEALGLFGAPEDIKAVLPVLLDHANVETEGVYTAILALSALDSLGDRAASIRSQLAELPRDDQSTPRRMKDCVSNLISHMLRAIEQPAPSQEH